MKNKKIKYINQKNMGPGIARKNGFLNSKGDLLFFIDSDDYLPNSNILNTIDNIFRNNENIDLLVFDFIRYINNKEFIVNAFFDKKLKEGFNSIDYLNNHKIAGALWAKIFSRKIMKEDFFINTNNYEDYYTTYAYLNECNNFYYTKNIFYYAYRDNLQSLTKKNNIDKMIKTLEICNKINKMSKFKKITTNILLNKNYECIKYILKNEEKNKYKKYINEIKTIANIKDYKINYIGIKEIIKKMIIKYMYIKYNY